MCRGTRRGCERFGFEETAERKVKEAQAVEIVPRPTGKPDDVETCVS